MTARPRRRFWLKLAAGLLFALVAYGGAYAALVRPVTLLPLNFAIATSDAVAGVPRVPRYALPRWQARAAQTFFAAAHWADRKMRPEFWDP